MSDKKMYETPVIYRVALTHEQAILSVCTTPSMSITAGTGPGCRPSNGCKRATGGVWDNAARPS